jgi:hypothetical protein
MESVDLIVRALSSLPFFRTAAASPNPLDTVLMVMCLLMGIGLLALIASVLHLLAVRRWSGLLALGLILLVVATGLLGVVAGWFEVERIVHDDLARSTYRLGDEHLLRRDGHARMLVPLPVAGLLAGLASIPFAAGEVRRRRRAAARPRT